MWKVIWDRAGRRHFKICWVLREAEHKPQGTVGRKDVYGLGLSLILALISSSLHPWVCEPWVNFPLDDWMILS